MTPLPYLPTEVGELVLDNAIAMLSSDCRRQAAVETVAVYGEAMKAVAGVSRFYAREVLQAMAHVILPAVDKSAQRIAKKLEYYGEALQRELEVVCRVGDELSALRKRLNAIFLVAHIHDVSTPDAGTLKPSPGRFVRVANRVCRYERRSRVSRLDSYYDSFPCPRVLCKRLARAQSQPPIYRPYLLWEKIIKQSLISASFVRALESNNDYTPGGFRTAVKDMLELAVKICQVSRSAGSNVIAILRGNAVRVAYFQCLRVEHEWSRPIRTRNGFSTTGYSATYGPFASYDPTWYGRPRQRNDSVTLWEEELVQALEDVEAFRERLIKRLRVIDEARIEEHRLMGVGHLD